MASVICFPQKGQGRVESQSSWMCQSDVCQLTGKNSKTGSDWVYLKCGFGVVRDCTFLCVQFMLKYMGFIHPYSCKRLHLVFVHTVCVELILFKKHLKHLFLQKM